MKFDFLLPVVALLLSIPILLTIIYLFRNIIWSFNPIFFLSNYIQWFFYNPLRFFFKNSESEIARKTHLFLLFTLISPLYWLIIHILLTPLRAANALYFDVLLYWSVMLNDSINDVFNPKIGKYRYQKGIKYLIHWVYAFPWRIVQFIIKSFSVVLDSFLMFGISIIFPTLTMYHGTNFNESATKIAQSGKWLVGNRNFAGTGVYFGIQKKVAEHYASSNNTGILIIRITTTFTRNQKTLKKELRELIGNDGDKLSEKLRFPWSTIEHWRESLGGWWEYCLVQPGKMGTFIDTWRIRPVAVLKDNKISRLWGGFSLYSTNVINIIIGSGCWAFLIYLY